MAEFVPPLQSALVSAGAPIAAQHMTQGFGQPVVSAYRSDIREAAPAWKIR